MRKSLLAAGAAAAMLAVTSLGFAGGAQAQYPWPGWDPYFRSVPGYDNQPYWPGNSFAASRNYPDGGAFPPFGDPSYPGPRLRGDGF